MIAESRARCDAQDTFGSDARGVHGVDDFERAGLDLHVIIGKQGDENHLDFGNGKMTARAGPAAQAKADKVVAALHGGPPLVVPLEAVKLGAVGTIVVRVFVSSLHIGSAEAVLWDNVFADTNVARRVSHRCKGVSLCAHRLADKRIEKGKTLERFDCQTGFALGINLDCFGPFGAQRF